MLWCQMFIELKLDHTYSFLQPKNQYLGPLKHITSGIQILLVNKLHVPSNLQKEHMYASNVVEKATNCNLKITEYKRLLSVQFLLRYRKFATIHVSPYGYAWANQLYVTHSLVVD